MADDRPPHPVTNSLVRSNWPHLEPGMRPSLLTRRASLLFGLNPDDPATMAMAAISLAVVGGRRQLRPSALRAYRLLKLCAKSKGPTLMAGLPF
jgi:hypothetical protein